MTHDKTTAQTQPLWKSTSQPRQQATHDNDQPSHIETTTWAIHGTQQPTAPINPATLKPITQAAHSTSQPWHWSTTPTAPIDPLTAPNHTKSHHTSHRWNAFLVLDLGLDVVNGVGAPHPQGVRKERWQKVWDERDDKGELTEEREDREDTSWEKEHVRGKEREAWIN